MPDNPSSRTYVAFDIEIARPLPGDFNDWRHYRPLGISCAATLTSTGELRVWHGVTPEGEIADQMNPIEAAHLVDYLHKAVLEGNTILTWNGLSFDFDILAEESGEMGTCQKLALDHVDMMFHFFCHKGYPLALDKAAKGMRLPGKPTGMSGAMAPIYWTQGMRKKVLDYVAQDAKTTLDLALAVETNRELHWTSNRGSPQFLPLTQGWLTVRQALAMPEPDTSWMSRPMSRRQFIAWLSSSLD
jgi:hypothetical protein